jgi:hypothetical protein
VEWLGYKESWADQVIGTELRQRLTPVVGLLHAKSTTQIPGSLRCKGFFHDASHRAFGIVYGLPPETRPVTLHGLLSKPKGNVKNEAKFYRPPLEFRFRLAFDICQCIYTFNEVGWLHRNLHSMNVLFFQPEGAENAGWAKEPRILGFAGSRENQLGSFTNRPDNNDQFRSYRHPDYLAHKKRYREEFEYYSVGILLLEIGFWRTLSKITEDYHFQSISDEQFRQKLIATRIQQLGVIMGTRYMEATRTCLEGHFGGESGDLEDESDSCHMLFKSLVTDRILPRLHY